MAEHVAHVVGLIAFWWYQPVELSRLTRPLDILICQRANLDYGVALHKAYAFAMSTVLLATSVAAVGIAMLFGYRGWDVLFGVVAPLLPSAIACLRDVSAHLDSARKKEAAQAKVADLWRKFSDLGDLEQHVIDTTNVDVEQTVSLVQTALTSRDHVIS